MSWRQQGLAQACVPAAAGTYDGMVAKLDYLQALGVNALELQPIHEFNELEYYQVMMSMSA